MMKKLFLFALPLMLLLGSCQNELEEQAQSKGLKVVSASIESQSSRLAVSYDNATNIFGLNWSEDDAFNAFGTNSTSAVYNWTSGNGFKMTSGSLNEPQYGIYPSSSNPSISSTTVTMTLPAAPTVGAINLPMWAATENGTSYAFKHLAAGLRVAVNTIPAGYNTLMVEASNAISGEFTANLGDATPALTFNGTLEDSNKKVTVSFTAANNTDTKNEVFYIPLPAGTYSTLKVTISNGNENQNINLKDWSNLTIVRGKMYYTTAVVDASTIAAVNQALANAGEVPVTVNMPEAIDASAGAIEIPDDAKEVTMNFQTAPTTSESKPLTINQNDGATSGEATSELNINMPAGATNLYATIDAPTTTATLNGGQYAKVTATTATNTLIIKSNVTIASLIIEGGNVIIEEGATIDDENITNNGNGTITYNEIVNSEAELNSAVANVDNSIVTLGADITMSEKLVIDRNLVLDGNDYTLTYTGDDRAIDMPSDTENGTNLNVTIQNLTVNCSATNCNRAINYNANGKLILDNVTVTGTPTTYALNFPGKSDKAQVDITNCQIKGLIALNVWGEDMIINVTNSILTSVDNAEAENYAAITLNNDGTTSAEGTNITIKGGKIVAKDEKDAPSAAVSNLTATGVVTIDATTEVTGFVSKPVAVIYYEGYNEFYSETDLQAAIDKVIADNNGKIRLISDITLESSLTIAQGGNVTIDLNGYTISQEKAQTTTYAMITNKGTLTIKDTSSEGNGKITYKDITEYTADNNYASNTIRNEGTLTLESGTIENISSDNVMDYGYPHAIDVYQGSTTNIKGGTVKSANYDCIRMFCNSTTLPTIVNISGGNIINRVTFQNPTNNKAGYGELNITGGTFTTTDNVNANVRLLNFSSDVSNMKAKISGGTFDKGVKTQNYGSWTANWEWLTIENNVINKIE